MNQRSALVLGAGPFAQVLVTEINARPSCGIRVMGMVAEGNTGSVRFFGCPIVGEAEDLQRILQKTGPDVVIVAATNFGGYVSDHQLMEATLCHDLVVEDGEAVYERVTGKLPIEEMTPGAIIFSQDFRPSRHSLVMARIFSLFSSLVGLVLFSPLLLLLALLIKLDSRGPVLFVQERIGRGGRRFRLYKFRTMHPAGHRTSEWAGDNTHRITRVGHWLRKFRLDELPQFINVIRGDMNLVGPRPHPACNYELFVLVSRNTPICGGQIPYYSIRSKVRPGITGWAQVRYRYANNLNEEIEKLRFDLYYVKHYSFWLDLRILFETVKVVFGGKESEEIRSTDKVVHIGEPLGRVQTPPVPPSRGREHVASAAGRSAQH